jgi:hypothetical protein
MKTLFATYITFLATFTLIGCGDDSSTSSSPPSIPETFIGLQEKIHDFGYAEVKEIYFPPSSYTTRKDELSTYEGDPCTWQICSYEMNTKDKVGGEINYIKNHYFIFSAQDIDPDSIQVYPYQGLGYFNVEMKSLDEKNLIHWRDKQSETPDDEWVQSKSPNANFVIGNDRELAMEAAEAFKKAVLECKNQPRPVLISLSTQFRGPVQPCSFDL